MSAYSNGFIGQAKCLCRKQKLVQHRMRLRGQRRIFMTHTMKNQSFNRKVEVSPRVVYQMESQVLLNVTLWKFPVWFTEICPFVPSNAG